MIEIWQLEDGEPVRTATVTLDGDRVLVEGEEATKRFLAEFAVQGPPGPRRKLYEITDGKPWVDGLVQNLRGTYFWAQEPPDQAA